MQAWRVDKQVVSGLKGLRVHDVCHYVGEPLIGVNAILAHKLNELRDLHPEHLSK